MNRLHRRLGIACVVIGAALAAYRPLRWLDTHFFSERLKDLYASWVTSETWADIDRVRLRPLDYGWLGVAGPPIRIAHALGASGTPRANTVAALDESLRQGYVFLEVDLWMDRQGVVYCHHGPGEPDNEVNNCTLDMLASRKLTNIYWILDIKTDFAATGSKALAAFASHGGTEHVIVQLYRPEDVVVFERWQQSYRLPGPIVTMYETHRSVEHVARHAAHAGIQAVAVPLERADALGSRAYGLRRLLHPVHDCQSWMRAQASGADGVFSVSGLKCDGL
jgi:hypothetical protein